MLSCLKGYIAAVFTFLNYIVYALGWLALVVTILKICLGREGFQKVRNYVFAFMFDNYLRKAQFLLDVNKLKERLFKSLNNDPESSKSKLQKKNGLDILEIGVGTGANLEYYPAGSRLVCVDPNDSFKTYFQQNCAKKAEHLDPDIRFLAEPGEDMVSVPDGSADVVVATLVLCSVREMARLLREVRRVLVPGGKFFFLEHVADEPGTVRRCIQNLVSNSDLWPALFDGCTMNREPDKAILKAGFSSVDHKRVYLKNGRFEDTGSLPTRPSELVNPFLYGVATK